MSKTIIVTGASSGIGKATCRRRLLDGNQVIGIARRIEKLSDLQLEFGNGFVPYQLDVTDVNGISELRTFLSSKNMEVDVLVNNAGVGMLGPIDEQPLEHWHTMMNVNVNGLLSMIHQFLPQIKERKGHIINIDSVAGHEVFPDATVYCASKWAVKAISMGLDKELRGHIKVTNISPGAVETEFVNQTTHPDKAEQMKSVFVDVLKSEDIANAVSTAVNAPDHVVFNEITIRPFK